ncbi:Pre-mRNA-splicing factor 38A [Schistosoma japonicum]|nr:Pre-mRNA-splicing factor 38A [Schistosoma japonicum]
MANRTVKDAHTVHGTNPQYLLEKIVRSRIYESKFWKEHCFALTAELLVDKAVELRYVGGVFSGSVKPTPFLCLTLKMLQIQPDKDIVIEFIKQEPYKYARALGAFYLRLVGDSVEIYKYLETLYNDFRRLKFQDKMGNFSLVYMDDFIDQLLTEERVCDVILPRLQKREVLEELNGLEPRQSLLNEDLEDLQYTVDELDTLNHTEENHKSKDRHRRRDHGKDHHYHRRKYREESPHAERREKDRDHVSSRHKDREDYERKHDREKGHRQFYVRDIAFLRNGQNIFMVFLVSDVLYSNTQYQSNRRSRSGDRRNGRSKRDDSRSPDHKRARDKDRDRHYY